MVAICQKHDVQYDATMIIWKADISTLVICAGFNIIIDWQTIVGFILLVFVVYSRGRIDINMHLHLQSLRKNKVSPSHFQCVKQLLQDLRNGSECSTRSVSQAQVIQKNGAIWCSKKWGNPFWLKEKKAELKKRI